MGRLDATDARLLLGLIADARASAVSLAARLGLSRNTVQARLGRLETAHLLRSYEHRVDPAALGYPLTAFLFVRVTQRRLDVIGEDLAAIPEVIEVTGLSGAADLLVRVAAKDDEHLYAIAGRVLAVEGVERTDTALAMRRMVDYRVTPLLRRLAEAGPRRTPVPGGQRVASARGSTSDSTDA
jgi:DNA-binding Lrp family transcriptional regulator